MNCIQPLATCLSISFRLHVNAVSAFHSCLFLQSCLAMSLPFMHWRDYLPHTTQMRMKQKRTIPHTTPYQSHAFSCTHTNSCSLVVFHVKCNDDFKKDLKRKWWGIFASHIGAPSYKSYKKLSSEIVTV